MGQDDPPAISLFPGTKGSATVTFAVPRDSSVRVDDIPFVVKVSSAEDRDGSSVQEGVLAVRPFADLAAELLPRTSQGVRRGNHEVAVDNYGNTPVTVTLSASDPDLRLGYRFRPEQLVVEPGAAGFAQVRAIPRKRLWRGASVTRPFQVTVSAEGHPLIKADGMFLQRPRIPAWAFKSAVMLILAVVGLALLWGLLLKPTLESTAQEAVDEPLAEQAAKTDDLAEQQQAVGIGVEDSPLEQLADAADDQQVQEEILGQAAGAEPYSVRLTVNGTGIVEQAVTIPEGKAFEVNDVLFQNPAGDSGTLELRRDGEVILRNNLASFRDLDFHFTIPIPFENGQQVVLRVECAGPAACTPSAYLAGTLKDKTPSSTTSTTLERRAASTPAPATKSTTATDPAGEPTDASAGEEPVTDGTPPDEPPPGEDLQPTGSGSTPP